jgi:hypothetical protein
MAIISISGYDVLIDDNDVESVNSRHWYINKKQHEKHGLHYFYNDRVINKKKITITLHRFIMNCTTGDGKIVDHISGNTLDCRKSNLRFCTTEQNIQNQKISIRNTSGYSNVQWSIGCQKWMVRVKANKCSHYIGVYKAIEEAVRIADICVLYFHGEYAKTNLPKDTYNGIDLKQEILRIKPCLLLKRSTTDGIL